MAAGLLISARRRLATLDRRNRPHLLGEQGVAVMRGRQAFERQLLVAGRALLGVFAIRAVIFLFMISAAGCETRTHGYCGDVGRPSDLAMQVSQTAALTAGALYAGAMSLRRTHERESERIDLIVAKGQRARRDDGPLAGASHSRWEYLRRAGSAAGERLVPTVAVPAATDGGRG